MAVGPCTGVTHPCHTAESRTVSLTNVTQSVAHSVTHQHTRSTGTAGTPHLSPCRVFALARCPCPTAAELSRCQARQAGSQGLQPGLQRSRSSAGSLLRASSARSPRGCGARPAEVLGMDAEELGRSHSQRTISKGPGPLPASSLGCRSTSPACPSTGGAVSPPPGGRRGGEEARCWHDGNGRGFSLHGAERDGAPGSPPLGRMLRAASAVWGWRGRQGACRGLISQPAMGFWGLSSASAWAEDKREGLRDGAQHGAAFEVGTAR